MNEPTGSGFTRPRYIDAMADWPCPYCGTMVGDTGMSSRVGIGPAAHPRKQHGSCAKCDLRLVRLPEADDPSWRANTDVREPAQLLLRLQALADRENFDLRRPRETAGSVWRIQLFEKRSGDRPPGQRTIRVVGTGATEEEALEDAIYDAETNGFAV